MRLAPLPALVLMAVSSLAQAQAPAAPADADKPLAVVNGKAIPALYGELVKREMAGKGQANDPTLDAQVRESLVNLELLSRAALDKGLDKEARFAASLDIRRKDMLAKVYLEDYLKAHPVTDADIQAAYDKAKAAPAQEEYKARHILVKTEAEAKKIIADLGKKAKFDDLAKKHSKDPGSAKNGGALDWADRGAYVKEFSDAMAGLKKGETTKTAVKSQFGYHVIRLDDVRKGELPPLQAVRGEIVKQLQQQRVREAIIAARAGAKIE
ncbi:MAG: peptidylprolyl isomerase [Thiobacillus sp.]